MNATKSKTRQEVEQQLSQIIHKLPLERVTQVVDFARFIEIAGGSVFEVVSECFVARRQNFLSDDNFRKIYAAAEEVSRMLSGLRRSLLAAK